MDWFGYKPSGQMRAWSWWKRLLIDILVAVLTVVVVTIPAYVLLPRERNGIATLLLLYLFVLIFLAHKGEPRIAIFAAIVACSTFDFFLVKPFNSLFVVYPEEWVDLIIFLVLAILLSWIYTQQRKLIVQAKQLSYLESTRYEERLRKQEEEVSRRDYELRTFYDVMEVSRDQKDLKSQLSQIAQAIRDTFAFCGIRGCSFYLPDLDSKGNTSMWVLSSQRGSFPKLAPGDEASVMWMMKHGEALTLPEIPFVSHAKGSYLRRVVLSNSSTGQSAYYCNYLAPLLSDQTVLGVMRLYVEDDGNPELVAIRQLLERGKEDTPTSAHSRHFRKLFDHAKFLIGQWLIGRALMHKESLRQELQKRTEEMHKAIISSVSHDFHTPLTQIMGAASGLLNRPQPCEDEAACRESLRAIVSETERLERIVAKMLALSRIEHGAFALKRELYPIEMIILNALDQGHMRSLKQGRHIEILVPDDVPAVMLDPDLIGQVFTNLIENAIRYTPVESPIEIGVRANDEQLYVTIADRGPGIPPGELERVFERFHRVKQEILDNATLASDQGSGLGLAVCSGFVHAHGGRIWAENRKNGGAKFTFTLPLHVAEGVIYEKDSAG